MLTNASPSLCLLNGRMDFNEIGIDKSLGDGKELVRFW